ncbi:hypothetical protein BXZ70DRAFT_1063351 [Cristinia sonorae]|uniref:RRM domain-containing protein n=1 Tax=Cristinia sonorae TaxID=1940300 RepID=A0A8K0USR1_9AGAR|nr:hypothetical protein BXZ70DRAFT_1063351 [Cristinia sonorae]
MVEPEKLTKKQKKALAFRERKGKARAKPGDTLDDEDNAVPVAEDQIDAEVLQVETPAVNESKQGSDKAVVPQHGVKRKREQAEQDGEAAKSRKSKKRKGSGDEEVSGGGEGEEVGNPGGEGEEEGAKKATKDRKQQRFILFVGNLKYTTSAETIREHFKLCDPPPTVRLRTPKPSETSRPSTKSKGFAFLEFENKASLQQALKLHHSQLEGRNINVELTAGGGGKSESRLAKLKTRNKELHDQRVKRIQKQNSKIPAAKEDAEIDLKPQRHSSTSGVAYTPTTKRTWTVGNTTEENEKRKKVRGKKPPRPQGTGVNAIPVG